MAMMINAKVVGYGPDRETTKALVNIIVEFSGPTETMTLTVIVPNEGDEAALEEQRIARTSLCNSLPTGPRRRNAGRALSFPHCEMTSLRLGKSLPKLLASG
jgi:hypothetical protein